MSDTTNGTDPGQADGAPVIGSQTNEAGQNTDALVEGNQVAGIHDMEDVPEHQEVDPATQGSTDGSELSDDEEDRSERHY